MSLFLQQAASPALYFLLCSLKPDIFPNAAKNDIRLHHGRRRAFLALGCSCRVIETCLVSSTALLKTNSNSVWQVAAFLGRHPHFAAEAPPPSARIPADVLTPEGFVATLPHRHGIDGAFAARLRRSG